MFDFSSIPIHLHKFCGLDFLIRRDDMISPYINGNKAYKFYFLLQQDWKHIVSYGGNQSNAMLALSCIARYKGAKFSYFTTKFSSYLTENLQGNLKIALDNGMDLQFVESKDSMYDRAKSFSKTHQAIFIPQGGATKWAKNGLEILAKEIVALQISHNLHKLAVFCASGTGTSSLYLQEAIDEIYQRQEDSCNGDICVVTMPCVGDEKYLRRQFEALCEPRQTRTKLPIIIMPKTKMTFAKPQQRIFSMYKHWQDNGVEFDLLYDCPFWCGIEDNLEYLKNHFECFLFLHSGGLSGNITQIMRYKYHFKNKA